MCFALRWLALFNLHRRLKKKRSFAYCEAKRKPVLSLSPMAKRLFKKEFFKKQSFLINRRLSKKTTFFLKSRRFFRQRLALLFKIRRILKKRAKAQEKNLWFFDRRRRANRRTCAISESLWSCTVMLHVHISFGYVKKRCKVKHFYFI